MKFSFQLLCNQFARAQKRIRISLTTKKEKAKCTGIYSRSLRGEHMYHRAAN